MSNQIGSLKMGQKLKKTPAGEIPVDWGVATIADLCQVNPEVIKESTPPDTQLKYIDIASIERTGSISIPKVMEFKDAPSRARRIVKAGDVIISTVRPYLKAFARITDASENLIASTGFAVLRARPNVNGSYVYQHVLSEMFVKYLEGKMTGSSYPAVNSSDVAEYQMPVPTALEQENIARILSEVDTLIDTVGTEIKKTKELRKGLMCQLLTRGVGHKNFKETSRGSIPTSWDVMPIKALAEAMLNGGTPDRTNKLYWSGTIPWISGADFSNQKVEAFRRYITPEAVNNSATNVIPKGALLVVTRTGVGKLAIAPVDVTISQDITGIIPKASLVSTEFMFWMLNLYIGKLKANHQGTSINGILREDLESFLLPIPPLLEQHKITCILMGCDDSLNKQDQSLTKLTTLKKSLMNMLLTGKVRV